MNWRDKIFDLERLPEWRRRVCPADKRLVATNGCFDLLHIGHALYLEQARAKGDLLIVGLNGDDSVRALKGASRPIQPEEDRAGLLAALTAVDAVCIFPEPTATRFLELAQPHVYVKGGDYTRETLNPQERQAIEEAGATVVFIPYLEGKSTSHLIARIRSLP